MKNKVERIYRKKLINCFVVSVDETHEIVDKVCTKCEGTGKLKHFSHVDNGICFKCGGSGKGNRVKIKKQTLKEIEDFKQKLKDKIENEKDEWRENAKIVSYNNCKNEIGVFKNTETVYIVMENNSYYIKDELKAMGAKWGNKIRRWYFEEKPNTNYKLKEINLQDFIVFSDNTNPDIVNVYSVMWREVYEKCESKF